MKKVRIVSTDSYQEKQIINFMYFDTTVVCVIQDVMRNEFKGVAKLHKEDVYDVTVGEDLAFKKALEKYENFQKRTLQSAVEAITKKECNKIELMKKRVIRARKNHKKKQEAKAKKNTGDN